jgi:HSP20 family protein
MLNDLALWRPFDEVWSLSDPFQMMRRWAPPVRTNPGLFSSVDVAANEDGWRLRVALPGMAPENVEVNATPESLRVRAIEQDGNRELTRYEQTISLPGSVDPDKISASFKHGLLEITLPVKDAVKPRRIAIGTTSEEPKQLNPAA